ncbi:MAG TPA: MBL fold metallo-hydrolase, partial [Ignavibacteriaceae bacterium]|nr:MBL fold metallo-hydrolase [Ignavibacteriaceae bacterium]
RYKILGKPGKDNALMVWIDSGDKFYRILFDCGEDVLNDISQSDIRAVDFLCFSHLHIDHAAGFDYFFRRNYERENKPVYIFGPEFTSEKIHNKLKGYTWNLLWEPGSVWFVSDILRNRIKDFRLNSSDGFEKKLEFGERSINNIVIQTEGFVLEAVVLNHKIPSIGYRIREKELLNADKEILEKENLPGGPWIEEIKNDEVSPDKEIIIEGKRFTAGYLRAMLLKKTKGVSIAYLTDFIIESSDRNNLLKMINGCDTLVCEGQYLNRDKDLAEKNFHLTASQAAEIAKSAGVKKLILIHISGRYTLENDYSEILSEARSVFPETYFHESWLSVIGER